MIELIKKKALKIKPNQMYSPNDIYDMGVIVNTKVEPSLKTVHRLIASGKLAAINIATGQRARFLVKGADLKNYLKQVYKF